MSSLVRLIMTVDARYHLLLTIPVCVEVYSSVLPPFDPSKLKRLLQFE